MEYEIREITEEALEPSVAILREAWSRVTGELGITEANSPRFPAFTTLAELEERRERGGRFFGAFAGGRQVGLILVEREEDGRYFAKRLAVLPGCWHQGVGARLMGRAIECVRDAGDGMINIAIVNEQRVLKDWYLAMGFREVETVQFPGVPFTVCFLEKEVA